MCAMPLADEEASDGTVLLIIDMIGEWAAPPMKPLLDAAKGIAPGLAQLKARCRQAGVPVIYVNDNLGRWRSDFKTLVQAALDKGGDAAAIAKALAPDEEDYFVLKPKQSAFLATPLDLLLQHLNGHRLILTGVSADQCVMTTAADALMRDYEVIVVEDAIAAPSASRLQAALRHFDQVMRSSVSPSASLRLPNPPPNPPRNPSPEP